ncbi:MAG TPA: hypothetical protein PLL76_18525 [Thermoanaerobaculia bacterium]|nr:hypothetical protein [Thermoanaerobaculia bacterium]
MATLADMIVRLQQVGEEMRAVAGEARSAAEEVEYLGRVEQEYTASTSSVSRAKGGTTGTMGSSHDSGSGGSGMPKAVTASGLAAALAVTRGRR